NVTLGRIHVLAPNTKKWGDRVMAAEAHGRETGVRNARDSQLRSKFSVIGDVVLVLKTVVSHGEFVHAPAADRPRMCDANLWAAHNLLFDGVDRLSGERQERPAAVPVIPVPVIPSKGPPQLLLAGKNMVDLARVGVP